MTLFCKETACIIIGIWIASMLAFSLFIGSSGIMEAFGNDAAKWNGEASGSFQPSDSMFLFANNAVSPEACSGASYSSSGGCVVMTPEQLKLIRTRGGNMHDDSF